MAHKIVTPNGMLKAINDNFDLAGERGVHTVTAEEAGANTLDIDTGKADATGFIVQIFRAGVNVMADAAVSIVDGVLTVADGAATYSVTAGDKVHWTVF